MVKLALATRKGFPQFGGGSTMTKAEPPMQVLSNYLKYLRYSVSNTKIKHVLLITYEKNSMKVKVFSILNSEI